MIIALVVTLILSGVGAGLLKRFRSFLKNLRELIIANEQCLDEDCTQQEMKDIIREMGELVTDGLGIWSALTNLFNRG